jgi:hypothetical protein
MDFLRDHQDMILRRATAFSRQLSAPILSILFLGNPRFQALNPENGSLETISLFRRYPHAQ